MFDCSAYHYGNDIEKQYDMYLNVYEDKRVKNERKHAKMEKRGT